MIWLHINKTELLILIDKEEVRSESSSGNLLNNKNVKEQRANEEDMRRVCRSWCVVFDTLRTAQDKIMEGVLVRCREE